MSVKNVANLRTSSESEMQLTTIYKIRKNENVSLNRTLLL